MAEQLTQQDLDDLADIENAGRGDLDYSPQEAAQNVGVIALHGVETPSLSELDELTKTAQALGQQQAEERESAFAGIN